MNSRHKDTATLGGLQLTAWRIEAARNAERIAARQQRVHERKREQTLRQLAEELSDQREIAALTKRGGPAAERRITILRLGILARKLQADDGGKV